jgi:hypothetical protein
MHVGRASTRNVHGTYMYVLTMNCEHARKVIRSFNIMGYIYESFVIPNMRTQ